MGKKTSNFLVHGVRGLQGTREASLNWEWQEETQIGKMMLITKPHLQGTLITVLLVLMLWQACKLLIMWVKVGLRSLHALVMLFCWAVCVLFASLFLFVPSLCNIYMSYLHHMTSKYWYDICFISRDNKRNFVFILNKKYQQLQHSHNNNQVRISCHWCCRSAFTMFLRHISLHEVRSIVPMKLPSFC